MSVQDQLNNIETKTYYDNNLLKSKTTRNGNLFIYLYDVHDRLIAEGTMGDMAYYLYDDNGNITEITTSNASSIERTYDSLNRTISKEEGTGTSTYEYDIVLSDGEHKEKTTDPKGNIVETTYDKAGRKARVESEGSIAKYEYNEDGSLNKVNYRDVIETAGNAIKGQVVTANYQDEHIAIIAIYEIQGGQKTLTQTLTTPNNGEFNVSVPSGTYEIVVEKLSCLDYTITDIICDGTIADLGKIKLRAGDVDGNQLVNMADLNAVITVFGATMGQGNYAAKFDLNEDGVIDQADVDILDSNYLKAAVTENYVKQFEIIEGYEYNPDKTLQKLTNKKSDDTIISEYEYEYDANNNITQKIDEKGQTVYTYDDLNRILTSDNNGKQIAYTYDNRGNITEKIETAAQVTTTTYTYDAKNQLTSEKQIKGATTLRNATYTYDANGNQLTANDRGWTYIINIYNARNELISALDEYYSEETGQYKYDAEGKRIEKTVLNYMNKPTSTTKFVYEGTNLILELDGNGDQKAQNVYGLALTARKVNDKTGYYLYNGHGDVERILDSESNAQLNKYYYDEYGNIKERAGSFSNPFRYAGYYYDEESQNYFLQSRYYRPEIMRFISEDTYRGNYEDPLSLNYYTYAQGNPLIYTDPDGHSIKDALRGILIDYTLNTAKKLLEIPKGAGQFAYNTITSAFSLGADIGWYAHYSGEKIGNNITYNKGYITEDQRAIENARINDLRQGISSKYTLKNIGGGMLNNVSNAGRLLSNIYNPDSTIQDVANSTEGLLGTAATIYGGYNVTRGVGNVASSIGNGVQINSGGIVGLANCGTAYLSPSISVTRGVAGAIASEAGSIASGTMLIASSGNNGGNNSNSEDNKRKANVEKQESDVWKNLDNSKNGRKTSGSGSNKQYYEWDYTHKDIEVYDSKGKHIGSMDPATGKLYKGAVNGRRIDI